MFILWIIKKWKLRHKEMKRQVNFKARIWPWICSSVYTSSITLLPDSRKTLQKHNGGRGWDTRVQLHTSNETLVHIHIHIFCYLLSQIYVVNHFRIFFASLENTPQFRNNLRTCEAQHLRKTYFGVRKNFVQVCLDHIAPMGTHTNEYIQVRIVCLAS